MGTIKKGILGGFSGKVGTVVGASWKGISYMRGQALHTKNPRTAGQIYQRDTIKAVTLALRPIASTLRLTFSEYAKKMSAFNKAVSENYKAAVVNQDGNPVVDYSKLIISKGSLMPFHYIFIEDANGRGHYYLSTIFDFTPYPEYDGLIFAIYNVDDNVWQTGVIKEHYQVGETLDFHGGMPLVRGKQYLGFACAYDPTTGRVSDPISEVRVEAY